MKVKKVLKIIGVILLIVLVLFLIHTIRNFIIISKLQDNIATYASSTNYHVKSTTKETNGIEMIANFYEKDEKYVSIIERNKDGEIAKISTYGANNKKGLNTYIENGESKVANIDNDGATTRIEIYNGVESDSKWHTFLSSMFAYIRSEKIDGKDCYVISNFQSFITLTPVGKNEYYVEKDTGLMIKSVTNDQTAMKEYEFNNVADSIFIEPDISKYAIEEN